MSRMVAALAVALALVSSGCGTKVNKKGNDPTLPSASEMFDKKAPGGKVSPAGSAGPK